LRPSGRRAVGTDNVPMSYVVYTSPYVPAEWIAGHGLHPLRVMPSGASHAEALWNRQGVCPYVRAFLSEVKTCQEVAGVVITTVCDQMRRAFDVVARVSTLPGFLMNVPSTWQSLAARRLYLEELNRLGGFMVTLGGTPPSGPHLAEVMRGFDDARASLRGLQGQVPARAWAEAVEGFGRTGRVPAVERECGWWDEAHPTARPTASKVPLALVGGPLRREDLTIFDRVEECGGYVALDATETGQRGLCRAFDRRRLGEEPLLELADAYFDGIQDVSRRPNHGFYDDLIRNLKDRDVRAIILHRYLWCDLWHAEVERLKERTGLPVLDLDADGDQTADNGRRRTRIGAFLEMLR